jgi:Tol biopolymer transport system component
VNPDGKHLRAILPRVPTSVPHWSPDGSKLALQAALSGGHSTIILNPDTGKRRVLSPPDPNIATYCSVWSPDATHFACDGESDSTHAVNGVYTIRSSDGRGLKRVTNADGALDIPIAYSPDGKQIVFGRVGPNHNCLTTSALYVVYVNGGGLRRITPWGFCDDDGSWSPDGTKIAFASGNGHGRIYVVHPDGSGLRKIPLKVSGTSGLGDVSWSPDGTKITFILGGGSETGAGPEGIYTANDDGRDLQRVTSSPTFDHETAWGAHPATP